MNNHKILYYNENKQATAIPNKEDEYQNYNI